ncbi:hypothetical protein GCM10011487_57270 [Steroidobacter agaridevorans]|uniref:Uncharacterized protein n=1 Tax=Steroidobacter agaridevorans TaxID=2695856 RepID=A0A829YK49_9GAMM|nr:hypothetical protein GCM10011487_57270 [Steroidobacter agaridevorans]
MRLQYIRLQFAAIVLSDVGDQPSLTWRILSEHYHGCSDMLVCKQLRLNLCQLYTVAAKLNLSIVPTKALYISIRLQSPHVPGSIETIA